MIMGLRKPTKESIGVETGVLGSAARRPMSSIAVLRAILGCQAKIDDVENVPAAPFAHDKVAWLDVAVDVTLAVDKLDAREGLVSQKEYCLEGEAAAAVALQVTERRAQKLHDHDLELIFASEPQKARYTNGTS